MEELLIALLIRKYIISLVLFIPISANAYFVDYLKVQYAGEIGLFSAGIGKNVTENYSVEYFHGYVPEDIGGHEIETFSFKNNYSVFGYERWGYYGDLYIGVNLYHVTGLEYQTSRHSSFPEVYYRVGSIRGLFYTGISLNSTKVSNHFGYFESGVNDIVLINYLNNTDVINLFDFVSLGLGYGYKF